MIKITIQTDADFTPAGKRRAQIWTGYRGTRLIRWYVSGRRYRALAITPENIALTKEWLGA